MSKYKYTSLLSSQYRSVFKSYHSLDKYEPQDQKDLLKDSYKKTNNSQFQFTPMKRNLYDKEKYHSINYNKKDISSKLHTNTKNITKTKNQNNKLTRTAQPFQQNLNAENQKMLTKIRNKYETQSTQKTYSRSKNHPHVQNQPTLSYGKFQLSEFSSHKNIDFVQIDNQMPCRRPYIDLNTITHKNNELRMKVSEINRKRNDIKLKIRVNNIGQISKKYNYLENNPIQNPKSNQNKQNYLKKYHHQPQSSIFLKQRDTNKMNFIFQRNFLENINQKSNFQKKIPSNDDENIKTPHFNHPQNKNKEIDAFLIGKKLQNFVKNTFTDRY